MSKTSFKNFLSEDNRSETFSLAEAAEYVSVHCMEAFKAAPVFRGVESKVDAMYVNPTLQERKSAHIAYDFYNLIVSNSPKWKEYPRRNRSLICITDLQGTHGYGRPFRVLCEDSASWGVCPTNDFWHSFEKTLKAFYIPMLPDLNARLATFFVNLQRNEFMQEFPHKNFSANYPSMITTFNAVDAVLKEFSADTIITALEENCTHSNQNILDTFAEFVMKFKSCGSVLATLDETLDPVKSKFTHVNTAGLRGNGKEIWTESPSILISQNVYKDFESLVKGMV